ncbi:MAG TPA: epoxide hydrolase [Phenylobacterium sp.]|nr:epoxide hydrolase [Phenylobacterium sp.]
MSAPRPFRIDVPQAKLDRIRAAVAAAELPPAPSDDADWRYGVDVGWLRGFLDHWAHAHDWRAEEARLNAIPQFLAEVDGLDLHFFHVRGSASRPRPLILTHGWPGSAYEFVGLIEPLCFPERFGGDPEDGFDVVAPSLPGVGFSANPPRPIGPRRIAGLFRTLMTDVLGYERFAAQGGDMGSAVSSWLGCDHADAVAAVHLNLCIPPMTDPTDDPDELAWRAAFATVQQRESAYMVEHQTKPQTVAAVLAASPVALAAWMLEKFHGWGDTEGDIERRFTKDQLIANLMFYLAEDKAGPAIWLYRGGAEERASGRFEGLKVDRPTAIAVFPKEFLPAPPRRTVERYYDVRRWTEMPSGGHFAALEEPQALVDDLRTFLRDHL